MVSAEIPCSTYLAHSSFERPPIGSAIAKSSKSVKQLEVSFRSSIEMPPRMRPNSSFLSHLSFLIVSAAAKKASLVPTGFFWLFVNHVQNLEKNQLKTG